METPEEFPTCDWCKRYLHRHMEAYYYGFNATGEKLIDNILCSVASAGKAFHHTDRWNEGGCTEVIQEAANAAKAELSALKQRVDDLELMLRMCEDYAAPSLTINDCKDGTCRLFFNEDPEGFALVPFVDGVPVLTSEAREALKGGR